MESPRRIGLPDNMQTASMRATAIPHIWLA